MDNRRGASQWASLGTSQLTLYIISLTEFNQSVNIFITRQKKGEILGRITKQPEIRRQEILAEARRLFIKNGFDNTGMSDIAGELGIASGLVYHYFKSKLDLLYSVLNEIADEETAASIKIIDSYPGTAMECLNMMLSNEKKKNEYDKLASSIANDKVILDYVHDRLIRSFAPVFTKLIIMGNEDGSWDCEYPEETTNFIIQGFAGSVRITDAPGQKEKMEKVLSSIVCKLLGSKAHK